MHIDLAWLDAEAPTPTPPWSLGTIVTVSDDPHRLPHDLRRWLGEPAVRPDDPAGGGDLDGQRSDDDAVLLWAARLGPPPPPAVLQALLDQPDDVWHAGLRLGTADQPVALDPVAATWMLNADVDPTGDGTSWRLTLEACLVRRRVLIDLGLSDAGFDSLSGAGLELGHRWLARGARLRHAPDLVAHLTRVRPAPAPPEIDGLRLVQRRYGQKWLLWSALRLAATRRGPLASTARAVAAVRQEPSDPTGTARASLAPRRLPPVDVSDARVTVLIPTVDRYPWLRVVLDQLRPQTLPAFQVVVIDQTPLAQRDRRVPEEFADLPLTWLERDRPGQCSARNAGLQAATGEYVLFIDDDDEIEPDLLERHVRNLRELRCDVSCGGVVEPGAGAPGEEFTRFRVSDTFPTNNTMVARGALARSGWFDLAYDRGERADHDLGMRLYLAGARLLQDPSIVLLHHRAPQGGLRVHRARVTTYGGSRKTILQRQPLAPTQRYLWGRYYTPAQQRDAEVLHLFGAISGTGPRWRRVARMAAQVALLPSSARAVARSRAAATTLAQQYPDIPHAPVSARREAS